MEREPLPLDDPRAWIRDARDDLTLARSNMPPVRLALRCFHAQQAAEKAIKGVLLFDDIDFPYLHDIAALLDLVEEGSRTVPPAIDEAARLTRFAVMTRYPFIGEVDEDQYRDSLATAERVVDWAEHIIFASSETD